MNKLSKIVEIVLTKELLKHSHTNRQRYQANKRERENFEQIKRQINRQTQKEENNKR